MRKPRKFPDVRCYKPARRGEKHHPWLLAYRDPATGKQKVVTASADPTVTERKARQISNLVAEHRLGLRNARQDRLEAQALRPVADHLADYRKAMIAKGNTDKQAMQVESRAKRLFKLADVVLLSEISESAVQMAVGKLRDEMHLGLNTCNHYLKAAKQFVRWCRRDGRLMENPLEFLEGFNIATDIRHRRRVLSDPEFAALVKAANEGEDWQGISGPDRSWIYVLAGYTGLRRGELASLTKASFHLDEDPPGVQVEARHSKHRRLDFQPIDAGLAEILRAWLAELPDGVPVLKVPAKAFKMIQFDLEAAEIPYETHEGHADFHSLRHRFGSQLAAGGASISVIQRLMRHSDIRLTARYVHPNLHDQLAALRTLPAVERPVQRLVQRAENILPSGDVPRTAGPSITSSDCTNSNNGTNRKARTA